MAPNSSRFYPIFYI